MSLRAVSRLVPALALAVLIAGLVAAVVGTGLLGDLVAKRVSGTAVATVECRAGAQLPRGAAPPPRPSGSRPDGPIPTGVQAGLRTRSGNDLVRTVRRLRDAGARFTREDFAWSAVEPHPGEYCWAETDRWMAVAAAHGLDVIAVADGAPEWATGAWNRAPTTFPALAAYAEFVRQVLGRYGSRGSFWRDNPSIPRRPIRYVNVWNEPYERRFWAGPFPDPAGYAGMFKGVVAAARPVDPQARFMLEAEISALGPGGQSSFLSTMFDTHPDLPAYVDVVSVHPYASHGAGPRQCTRTGPAVRRRFQVCRVEDVRHFLDSRGAQRAPLWITELGWSTAPGARGAGGAVDEATQAAYLRQTFAELRTRWAAVVDGIVWYAYSTPERDPRNAGDWFGLVHPDGRPKPAFGALAAESVR